MFPLRAFCRNVLFGSNGKAYGLYRLAPQPYRFLAPEHKEAAVAAFEEMLFGLSGTGQVLLLWEEVFLDEGGYAAAASTNFRFLSKRVQEELVNHVRAARAAVGRGARILRRYLVLELPKAGAVVGEWREALEGLRDAALRAFLAVRPEGISSREAKAALAAEEELFLRLKRYGVERANFCDLDFIVRRSADRVSVLPLPLPERRAGFLSSHTVAAFTNGAVVEERLDHVLVRHPDGREHYQSFVSLVDVPKRLAATGYSFFSPDDLGFPFDAVLHFRVTQPHRAAQEVEKKRRLLRGQMEEAERAEESPDVLEEAALLDSKALDAKIEAGQPLAEVGVTLAVAGRDLREVRARASQLCQRFSSSRFRAVVPAAKQMAALFSFLPGSPSAFPTIKCDPGFIAAMGPHFAAELGDPKGFFLGWSGLTPVFWQPGRSAVELNKTNAILITGSLGSGKSHTAKLLTYFTLLAGGYVFAVDPKGEHDSLRNLFPDTTRVVNLSPRGGTAFNPLRLSRNPERAKSIAFDYLTITLNAGGNEVRRLALGQAIEAVFQLPQGERTMSCIEAALVDLSKESPDAGVREEASRAVFLLRTIRQTDVGRLVFGADVEDFFSGGERCVIVNIKELPRPRAGSSPEQWTESERQGVAVLYLLAALGRETAFGLPRELPKLLLYDEAWVLASTAQGQQLLDEVVRIGRTFNLIPVIVTQNLSDVAVPVILNNVSQVFCFRASETGEVALNLKVLGAGPKAVPTETFTRLDTGVCLFRDAEDRIGWLRIEPQPSYLNEVFDTRPSSGKEVS